LSRHPHRYRQRLLRNTIVTGATGAWAVLLAAAVVPVLLTQLGTEQFGLWALVWSFSAINGWPSVATVGLGVACTRRVAAALVDDRPDAAAGTVTVFVAVGAVLGATMATLGAALLPALVAGDPTLEDSLTAALRWSGLWIGSEAVVHGCGAALEGTQRVDRARTLDAVRRTVVTGAAVLAALDTGSLEAVMAASALAALFVAIGGVGVMVSVHRQLRPLGRPRQVGVLTREAVGFTTLNASGVLHRSMDRLLVATMIGPAAVAAVEVASRLRDIAQLVLSTSSYTAISAASWLDAQGEPVKLRRLVEVGSRLSLLATWSTVAVLAVFVSPILDVWLGAEVPDGVTALALLGLAYTAVHAPFQVGVNVLTGAGRVGRLNAVAWAGVVINLAASLVLIDRLGVTGAFVGTLCGSALVVPMLARLLLDELETDTRWALHTIIGPVLAPVGLIVIVGLVVVAAGWAPTPTLVVGAGLTVAVAVPAALRWTVHPDEVRELLGSSTDEVPTAV